MSSHHKKLHFETKELTMQAYCKELIQTIFDIEKETGGLLSKQNISALKNKVARQYELDKPPRDMDIMLSATEEDLEKLHHLRSKPTRSLSGVAVVAVMTKPEVCPHGKCTFCPGGLGSSYGDTPPSYTGFEPSTRRAIRNDYDSFLITFNRLEQYILGGHNPNKVDAIVMGGTFPSYDVNYQYEFITGMYLAMNVFSELFYITSVKDGKISYRIDYTAFKEFFELPHDVKDGAMEERLKQKIKEIKKKYLAEYIADSGSDKVVLLEYVKKRNETIAIRCIGLTEETRPDCAFLEHANQMLDHGVTRVELGIQSVYNEVLDITFRAHTVEDSVKSNQVLKDLGFKVNFHMMTAMPLTTPEMDKQNLHEIFENPAFKPDMLKVYPTLVMPGTKLFNDYKKGNYKPMRLEETSKMLGDFLPFVPSYCRIMRIQRDIPSTLVADGVLKTNLKQYVDAYMKENGLICRDIRAREIARLQITDPKPEVNEIKILEYEASGGVEFFISMEDTANDILHGFCRLRFPKECLRSEFTLTSAIVRELHVYGSALNIGEDKNYAETSSQHKGFGKLLMAEAEKICKENSKDKLLVISGVGVREYYRKLGYANDGPYVSKAL